MVEIVLYELSAHRRHRRQERSAAKNYVSNILNRIKLEHNSNPNCVNYRFYQVATSNDGYKNIFRRTSRY